MSLVCWKKDSVQTRFLVGLWGFLCPTSGARIPHKLPCIPGNFFGKVALIVSFVLAWAIESDIAVARLRGGIAVAVVAALLAGHPTRQPVHQPLTMDLAGLMLVSMEGSHKG
jgi:hypothetical protein